MPEYIEFEGKTYRVVRAKYNGTSLDNCLIPESEYKDLKYEKKSRTSRSRSPNKVLANQLDVLWSKRVKERDGFTCQKCGSKDKQLNSHHIFSRRHKAIRWDLDNGITLCAGCHKFSNGSAHVDPDAFIEWYKSIYGECLYNTLKWKSKATARYAESDLEIMLAKL